MPYDSLSLFFGDLHNHNALGYGLGSLERTIDVARSHLDFFAFTGHSSWHDMRPMEGGRERNWLAGFEKLRSAWPSVQQAIAASNAGEAFTAFLGFEWHSSRFGDQCVIFPDDFKPLHYADDITALRSFCSKHDALMIPHHLAYPAGGRGVNWDAFDSACSPVVEVYSEHGNGEDDRGPFPYFNHSMGGRVTSNTAQAGLDRGLKFGFVASSDNHRGFPGAYGEGLLGVWAKDLSRASLFEAIRGRRTYGITGDRIDVGFSVDGHPMGSHIRGGRAVEVAYDVNAKDELDVVEVICNGDIVDRGFTDQNTGSDGGAGTFQVRFEWGWGPWADLDLDRTCDWSFELAVSNGRLLAVTPCLQSGPFDENRRHRIDTSAEGMVRVTSYTARKGAYRQNPNQSLILEVEGDRTTVFDLNVEKPAVVRRSLNAAMLDESSVFVATGAFPGESCLWHRLVHAGSSSISRRFDLELSAGRTNYLYLRARQRNGHMAWASPIFVDVDGL